MAEQVARATVAQGGAIVTGLATGADVAAHRAVSGSARTLVAVLGTGLRHVYPKAHSGLAQELIRTGGSVLSELPPGVRGNAHSFILRNRIVAALADLVVAVSGRYASGTAHTIRFAESAGTPVVSADPASDSGITRLVLELGGVAESLASIEDRLSKLQAP